MRRRPPVALLAKRCKEALLAPFAQVERHCWDWGFGMVDQALLLKGLNAWQRAIVHNEAEVRVVLEEELELTTSTTSVLSIPQCLDLNLNPLLLGC